MHLTDMGKKPAQICYAGPWAGGFPRCLENPLGLQNQYLNNKQKQVRAYCVIICVKNHKSENFGWLSIVFKQVHGLAVISRRGQ